MDTKQLSGVNEQGVGWVLHRNTIALGRIYWYISDYDCKRAVVQLCQIYVITLLVSPSHSPSPSLHCHLPVLSPLGVIFNPDWGILSPLLADVLTMLGIQAAALEQGRRGIILGV